MSAIGNGYEQAGADMARRCFFSFHYIPDNWRASTVRNIGAIQEGSRSVTDNEWESITNGGAPAIQRWIANEMHGKSCTIVLIGANTANRKWINYEIEKTWADKKGIVGINIHRILDRNRMQSAKGANPFDYVRIGNTPLSWIAKVYDPPYADSQPVYNYIASNVERWVDEAIAIRGRY